MEIVRVVGRSPIAKTSSPSKALMNVLLPLLYSPTTTSRNSSSISSTRDPSRSRSAREPSDRPSMSRTRSTSLRSSATSSPCCRVRTCSIRAGRCELHAHHSTPARVWRECLHGHAFDQRNHLFGETLHFLQLRAELEEQQIYSRLLERDYPIGHNL